MRIYKTKYGDTWDAIARKYLGDEFAMDDLLAIQSEELLQYYILPDGLEIVIPDDLKSDVAYFRAPWAT